MRILYVSGGSAGHLAPLVSVERAIKKLEPEAESLFLCSDRPEDAAYLRHEHVRFLQIPSPRRTWTFPLQFVRSEKMSRTIMMEYKPDIIFSKGGAVSVPACRAAKKLGIPIVLHESDAVMGRANKIVARWAHTVCLGFPIGNTDSYQLSAISSFTGNPIRPQVTTGKREEGLSITKLSGKRPILLVFGGSQGAEVFNALVRTHLNGILAHCDVIHLTGKGKKGATPRAGYWSAEFAYEELPHLYAATTFALSRAGAGSMSELAANGIPAILVPIEGLANNHQVKNAHIAAEHGGCILIPQREMETTLIKTIDDLANDPERIRAMSKKIRVFQQPDAARRIAEILLQCLASGRKTD